jgi:hypothetical protein
MNQKSLSQTRLEQFHQMQSRLGDVQFEKAMTTHRAPIQLRRMAWCFSKLVNGAMRVAGAFQTPTRGDLSLLTFELLALGYFMPMRDLILIDEEIVRLSEAQTSIVEQMRRAGMLENPDEHNPLVQDYVRVVDEAEELIQRVHAEYRRHVVLW